MARMRDYGRRGRLMNSTFAKKVLAVVGMTREQGDEDSIRRFFAAGGSVWNYLDIMPTPSPFQYYHHQYDFEDPAQLLLFREYVSAGEPPKYVLSTILWEAPGHPHAEFGVASDPTGAAYRYYQLNQASTNLYGHSRLDFDGMYFSTVVRLSDAYKSGFKCGFSSKPGPGGMPFDDTCMYMSLEIPIGSTRPVFKVRYANGDLYESNMYPITWEIGDDTWVWLSFSYNLFSAEIYWDDGTHSESRNEKWEWKPTGRKDYSIIPPTDIEYGVWRPNAALFLSFGMNVSSITDEICQLRYVKEIVPRELLGTE